MTRLAFPAADGALDQPERVAGRRRGDWNGGPGVERPQVVALPCLQDGSQIGGAEDVDGAPDTRPVCITRGEARPHTTPSNLRSNSALTDAPSPAVIWPMLSRTRRAGVHRVAVAEVHCSLSEPLPVSLVSATTVAWNPLVPKGRYLASEHCLWNRTQATR